jgi:hypothetical protein
MPPVSGGIEPTVSRMRPRTWRDIFKADDAPSLFFHLDSRGSFMMVTALGRVARS